MMKYLFGVVAVALMAVFLAPIVFKLRELALIAVIGIGFVMMLIDLWQDLRE